MANEMLIRLPGNMMVDAEFKGFTIKTDQPKYSGGDGTQPAPYDLFLASIGTCAGIFVAFFCHERKIPYEDITLTMTWDRDPGTKLPCLFKVDVKLPPEFPEKYRKALEKAVEQCTVKRTMADMPGFEVTTSK